MIIHSKMKKVLMNLQMKVHYKIYHSKVCLSKNKAVLIKKATFLKDQKVQINLTNYKIWKKMMN